MKERQDPDPKMLSSFFGKDFVDPFFEPFLDLHHIGHQVVMGQHTSPG